MFRLYESFERVNDRSLPYTMYEENLHPYSNPSATVEDGRLLFGRKGARYILKTPPLAEFKLSVGLGYLPPAEAFESHVEWVIFIGYDEKARSGKKLSLGYFDSDKRVRVRLSEVTGRDERIISEKSLEQTHLLPHKTYPLTAASSKKGISVSLADREITFDTVIGAGRIALSSAQSVKGLLFSDLLVESESAEGVTLSEREYTVPHFDGGSEDYRIRLTAKRYGDIYEISYSLDGGAFSRGTPDYGMVIWSVQYDIITNAYIKFYGKCGTERLYLKNGELRFVEQNETLKSTELMLNGESMPYEGRFYLAAYSEDDDFAFGYDMLRRLGNELQEGGRELVYRDGELIYSGDPLSSDHLLITESPQDKEFTRLIPRDIDLYDKALLHAATNHYFTHNEQAILTVTAASQKNADLVSVRLTLLDAFFNEIKELTATVEPTDKFAAYGFVGAKYTVRMGKMPQGVYHLRSEILLGEQTVKSHTSAFEVFDDSEISPRESSGIPFMYSGEAAPPNIEFNCPDPWMIKPDHNAPHYFECMLGVPEIVENRRGWELLRLYKRKMFLWLEGRTKTRSKTYRDFPLSISYADYLKTPCKRAPQTYLTFPDIFKNQFIRNFYHNFCAEHTDYSLPEVSEEGMCDSDFKALYRALGTEWINYLSDRLADTVIDFHQELRNEFSKPNLKFATYGPYAVYGTRLAGPKSSELRAVRRNRAHEIMDGFWVFEDYPFITGQSTHYSSWSMMGLLMTMPEARIAVELFCSFDPVCPDGFVYYAFPPMGGVYVESYRVVTQIYEHLYSAVYRDGGFRYYQNHAFQFLQSYNTEASRRLEEFLKGWGVYLKNKPKRPERAPVFIVDYTDEEDRYEFDFSYRDAGNVSQTAEAYLHEIIAEAGLPRGFATDFRGITELTERDTDLCILPSLEKADPSVIEKIRELQSLGVSLIAVGDVGELCHLFGVEKEQRTVTVKELKRGNNVEIITVRSADFAYKVKDAEVLLYAVTDTGEELPFVTRKGNNVLINAYLCHVGRADFVEDSFGVANTSRLLREVMTSLAEELCRPLVTVDRGTGIRLFTTEDGERRILLTDQALCSDRETRRVTVRLSIDAETVECVCHKDMAITPSLIKKDGKVKAFSLTLRPGECVMYRIK